MKRVSNCSIEQKSLNRMKPEKPSHLLGDTPRYEFSCADFRMNQNLIFILGRCPAVFLNGFRSRRGREVVLRAGDDHEEALARPRGAGMLTQSQDSRVKTQDTRIMDLLS